MFRSEVSREGARRSLLHPRQAAYRNPNPLGGEFQARSG